MFNLGPDKIPKLFDGSPPVTFSLQSKKSQLNPLAEGTATISSRATKYIIPTPFNIIPLYKKVLLFESEIRKILESRTYTTTAQPSAVAFHDLGIALENLTRAKLLPLVQGHALGTLDEALTSAVEPTIVNLPTDPPVVHVALVAVRLVRWLYQIPESLQFSSKDLQKTADILIGKVIKWSFDLLKRIISGTGSRPPCSTTKLLPIISDVMRLAERSDTPSNSPSLDRWSFLSTLQTDDEARVAYFEEGIQPRDNQYVESSQELGTITMLTHSLEWMADQLAILMQDDTSLATNDNLSMYTPCFTTLFPGKKEGEEDPIPEVPHILAPSQMGIQYKKLMVLSRGIYFVLQMDLSSRCSVMLDQRNVNLYSLYGSNEPDEYVEVFNRDMRRVHITLTRCLPPNKHRDLLQWVPYLLGRNLMKYTSNLKNKSFTNFGIQKLNRNLVALQQNLALLVADVEDMDDRVLFVRNYYQCFEYFETDSDIQDIIQDLYKQGANAAQVFAIISERSKPLDASGLHETPRR